MDVVKTIVSNIIKSNLRRDDNNIKVSLNSNITEIIKEMVNNNKEMINNGILEANIDSIVFYLRIVSLFIYILLSLFCISYYKKLSHLTIYEILFFITFSTVIIKNYNNKLTKRVVYIKNIKVR